MQAALLKDVADFHDDVVRNIKGIRASQNLFDDLSDDGDDQAVAVAAESADPVPSEAPLITRAFDYGAVITYPFVKFNAQGTRFSDGLDYRVWYGSLALETTVHETVHHWHEFIADSFRRAARCHGTNADIFAPGVLSRVRDLCFLTYRMNPVRDLVRVERTPGRKWLEIRPSSLR